MIKHSSESKVANFEVTLLRVDEKILRLDVSVDHVVAVAVLNRFEDLVQVNAHISLLKAVRIFF